MKKKDEIKKALADPLSPFKNRFFEVPTEVLAPDYKRRRGDIRKWADEVAKSVYGKTLNELEAPVHFSYIKFVIDNKDNVYGIVGGKSQFHKKYTSDICFYDLKDKKGKKAPEKMMTEHLKWYTDSVFIIKNEDDNNSQEAFDNEKELQKAFDLLD